MAVKADGECPGRQTRRRLRHQACLASFSVALRRDNWEQSVSVALAVAFSLALVAVAVAVAFALALAESAHDTAAHCNEDLTVLALNPSVIDNLQQYRSVAAAHDDAFDALVEGGRGRDGQKVPF